MNSKIVLPFLYLLGAVLSIVLIYHHLALRILPEMGPSFCNINAAINCDAVSMSRYSEIGGIPLAVFGLIFYLELLFLSLFTRRADLHAPALDTQLLLLTPAVLISGYLFYVSEMVIGALCLLCVGLYLVNLAAFLLAYREGKSASLGSRYGRAVGAIGSFFASIAGLGSQRELSTVTRARIAFCIGVVMLVAGSSVAPWIAKSLLSVRRTQVHAQPSSAQLVAQWRAEPTVDIEVNTSGGWDADYVQGPAAAPVRIVEFSDFECPACRRFFVVLMSVIKDFNGKVDLVYRNYPLDKACNPSITREMHKNACHAAQFARCAGEQGKFWEVADYLFTLEAFDGPGSAEQVRAAINESAVALSLDTEGIAKCMSEPRQQEKLMDDIRIGNSLGVEGTPSIWINGKRLRVPTEQALRAVISYILEGK